MDSEAQKLRPTPVIRKRHNNQIEPVSLCRPRHKLLQVQCYKARTSEMAFSRGPSRRDGGRGRLFGGEDTGLIVELAGGAGRNCPDTPMSARWFPP
eukprot:472564-Amphidinium_carterae.1